MTDDALWYEAALLVGTTNAINVVADSPLQSLAPTETGPEAEQVFAEIRAFYARAGRRRPAPPREGLGAWHPAALRINPGGDGHDEDREDRREERVRPARLQPGDPGHRSADARIRLGAGRLRPPGRRAAPQRLQ